MTISDFLQAIAVGVTVLTPLIYITGFLGIQGGFAAKYRIRSTYTNQAHLLCTGGVFLSSILLQLGVALVFYPLLDGHSLSAIEILVVAGVECFLLLFLTYLVAPKIAQPIHSKLGKLASILLPFVSAIISQQFVIFAVRAVSALQILRPTVSSRIRLGSFGDVPWLVFLATIGIAVFLAFLSLASLFGSLIGYEIARLKPVTIYERQSSENYGTIRPPIRLLWLKETSDAYVGYDPAKDKLVYVPKDQVERVEMDKNSRMI